MLKAARISLFFPFFLLLPGVATGAPLGAAFVSQDLPPVAVRGETYSVKVTMRNTGTLTWTTPDFVLSVPGDDTTWTQGLPNRQALSHSVAPGQEVTFNLQIKAPVSAPFRSLTWRMLKVGQGRFGDSTPATLPQERDMSHRIRVVGDRFLDGDVEMVVRGFNHLPGVEAGGSAGSTYLTQDLVWLHYDPVAVGQELRAQARLGANVVRLWAPAAILDPTDPASVEQICGRFDHYLDEAYKNGIRVALTLHKSNGFSNEIWAEFCPGQGDFCSRNHPGFFYSLMFSEPLRAWTSRRNLDNLAACGVLADPRPRIFSIELWNEPNAGDARSSTAPPSSFTGRQALLEAWHTWVLARFGTLSQAMVHWGYKPQLTCGADANLLCSPSDIELCCDPEELGDPSLPAPNNYSCIPSTTKAGPWKYFALDYRTFLHERLRLVLQNSLAELRAFEASQGIPAQDRHLTRLSLPSIFASNRAQYDSACKSGVHAPDPWVVDGLTDYRSTHLYPWNDTLQDYRFITAASLDPQPWGLEGAGQRYHQIRMMLDNLRGDQPVVLEESGYTELCVDQMASPGTISCAEREEIQREIFTRTVAAVAASRANGLLFWHFAADTSGVLRDDLEPRLVYADLPTLFAELEAGRLGSPASPSPPPMLVDPCVSNNWGRALMRHFDDYLAAASDGQGGWRPVPIVPAASCRP